jgi:hypothetical protein
MMLWALIINGIVFEITTTNPAGRFPPEMEWVECASDIVPGYTYNGTTFAAPVAPVPTPAELAAAAYAAAIAAGVTITSAGNSALDGTYAITESSKGTITAEQVYIATTTKFTNGQTSRAWPDINGAYHTFPTTAEFTAFAEATAFYVDSLNAALAVGQAGGAWVAPPMPPAIP